MSHGVLGHIGGLGHTLMSIYCGATTIASRRMTPTETYLEKIYKYGATYALGIEVFLRFYLSHPSAEKYIGTLNRVLDGGGPLFYQYRMRLKKDFGISVIDCFSLTNQH